MRVDDWCGIALIIRNAITEETFEFRITALRVVAGLDSTQNLKLEEA
jgi:predicted component of type VI protein secretion system